MLLTPGTLAPDFTLYAAPNEAFTLASINAPAVLIFYPADWSPVCSDELSMFAVAHELFSARGAQLLGISVDSVWSHLAFRADRKLHFPLLADFHPQGATAKAYGVYRDGEGTSERALFVIDRDRRISWSFLSPIDVSPGVDGALAAVEALA